METKEKTCANCKYYFKHYVIYKVRLREVGGQCFHNRIMPYNRDNVFKPRQDCKYWEDGTDVVEDRRERALNEISKIRRALSDIALILNTLQ